MSKKNVERIENEEEQKTREMIEGIALNITRLSNVINALLGGKLQKKSIVILLASSAKMHMNQVEKVLDALQNFAKDNLK